MKVTAILHVKDEIELIGKSIAHLRAIGVDHVIACDYRSGDGTLAVLEENRSEYLSIIHVDDEINIDVSTWGLNEAALARSSGADWVMFLDADEFWLPSSGFIKDSLKHTRADMLTVDRFNVPLGADGPWMPDRLNPRDYSNLMLFVRPSENFYQLMQKDPSIPWISGVPMPKIIVKPWIVGSIHAGHHGANTVDGMVIAPIKPSDILIAHVPFTTRARFQRKVKNIRNTLSIQRDYHSEGRGWHWKRWAEFDSEQSLDDEFGRQIVDEIMLKKLRSSGIIRSASEMLASTI